jgi:putative multiple sugar transport system substrate-binding protein
MKKILALVLALALCIGCVSALADGEKVGVSMPTKDLQRWVQDGENMQKELEAAGFAVELQYASNDIATQLNQIDAMIDNGCNVIVISAIEGSSLGQALDKAAEKGVKVIAYDRLLMDNANVDYYATFNNYMVGTVQGTYVKEKLDLDNAEGPFYMEVTAGDPGDNNARYFYQGAIDVLMPYIESGKIVIRSGQIEFADVATPTWKTDVAQKRADDILAGFYTNGEQLDVWLCSNDSTALGVTNALDNYTGEGWPIITGQDCDIANTKNMIAGKQAMSVFKDTRTLAARVVTMIKQILAGEEVEVNDTETYDNNVKVVPSFLCEPVFANAENYKELLVDSGYYTEDQLQ